MLPRYFGLYRGHTFTYFRHVRAMHVGQFSRNGAGRGWYIVEVTGYLWQVPGLCDCYGVYVARTGKLPSRCRNCHVEPLCNFHEKKHVQLHFARGGGIAFYVIILRGSVTEALVVYRLNVV